MNLKDSVDINWDGIKADRSMRAASIVATAIALGLDDKTREHPAFTREVWKFQVARDITRLGYIDWLVNRLEEIQ